MAAVEEPIAIRHAKAATFNSQDGFAVRALDPALNGRVAAHRIKSLALDVGIRRPLGVGAGGLAILCALPADEAESIIDTNAPKYEKYGFITAAYLREAIKVGRDKGYAFLDSVVDAGHRRDRHCLSARQPDCRDQRRGDLGKARIPPPR